MPEVKWRLASSFPKSLDTIYGSGEFFAKRVAALTDNKFQIRVFAAGEIVPGLQVLDSVQNETVECGHTASYYYVGKDPTFAFDTAVPFGLNTRQHNAWVYHGGGLELMREFYKEYNVTSFLVSHTGAQMGGWFRKEIKTVDDMKGVKMRIGGFAGQVMSKLGVVPQQIAGGEIYPALEKGTIDAAEWVGPYDDQKLGFNKVAPHYYYPGWWEGGAALSLYIGLKAFDALPPLYKEAIASACAETVDWSVAKYDAQNPKALRELVAGGTKLAPYPVAVLEACYNAAVELYAETTAKNAKFKKVFDSWKAFRNDQVLWFRVAEGTFDSFMGRMSAQNKL
jgi:TRAP-type mannitol/chloroaromatic compound transport system substrate-binding protein